MSGGGRRRNGKVGKLRSLPLLKLTPSLPEQKLQRATVESPEGFASVGVVGGGTKVRSANVKQVYS